jgi:hypothetical protein
MLPTEPSVCLGWLQPFSIRTRRYIVLPTGFEPAVSSLRGKRDNLYSTGACLESFGAITSPRAYYLSKPGWGMSSLTLERLPVVEKLHFLE